MNPKLRPRWKGPYLVTGILNEVDAILKADGRSRKTIIVHFSKLKKCFGNPFIVPMNRRDQSIEESNVINETESEHESPVSKSPNKKRRMENAGKPEEDSSSEERDLLRRDQKEPTSQRNEEPEVGTCSKLRPYQTMRHQKEQSTCLPREQVGKSDEDNHLGFEGYASDITVNKIFNHGTTSNEKPAMTNSQTTNSVK